MFPCTLVIFSIHCIQSWFSTTGNKEYLSLLLSKGNLGKKISLFGYWNCRIGVWRLSQVGNQARSLLITTTPRLMPSGTHLIPISIMSCVFLLLLNPLFASFNVCVLVPNHRKVWPEASGIKVFFCLWHVRKIWLENATQKIKTIYLRTLALQACADRMYGAGGHEGEAAVQISMQKFAELKDTY